MLVLLTFGLYALALLAIGILRLTRRSFSYAWLASALGALLAWVSVFFWQAELPARVHENTWLPERLFSAWPILFLDEVGWAYGLALATLALAVVLTAPAQSTGISPAAWVGTLGLTGLGMLASLAGNPMTLVMIWTAIDLLELINTLRLERKTNLSERAVISFGIRALGTGFSLWAIVTSTTILSSFDAIVPQSALFFLIAAGLRLGVLPLHLTYRSEPALRRGMGTVLRMVAASSSLVLLARIPGGLLESVTTIALQVFLLLALLYAAWKWLTALNELPARPYWLIALGALSLLAALRGNPQGSLAWGLTLVLYGGLVFLYASRQRGLTIVLSVLVLGMFSLPFTLTATTWQGSASFDWLFWPFVVVGQVMLAIGFVRHLWHTSESQMAELPRWAQSAYPLGLLTLAVTILLFGLWGWSGALQVGLWPVGLAVTLLSVGVLVVWWRISQFGDLPLSERRPLSAAASSDSRLARVLEWIASLLWGLYRSMRRLVDFFSGLLEGDGGLLWTLLVLILLLIWFQQISM
jgi:hypothetical protein